MEAFPTPIIYNRVGLGRLAEGGEATPPSTISPGGESSQTINLVFEGCTKVPLPSSTFFRHLYDSLDALRFSIQKSPAALS